MFQSPLGALCHTRLVMGHTNSVQIMQGDINYILRDEIPLFTVPFIDDVAVKGPVTRCNVTYKPDLRTANYAPEFPPIGCLCCLRRLHCP
jgi:hypothetical protein